MECPENITIYSEGDVIKIRMKGEIYANDLALLIGNILRERMPECNIQVERFEWVTHKM